MPGTQSKASRYEKPGKRDPLKEEKANQTKWIQKCHTGVLELTEQNKTIVHIFQNLIRDIETVLKPQIQQVKYSVCAMKTVVEGTNVQISHSK